MIDPQKVLSISRQIAATPAQVWTAWSQPEHLARWWIPAPIACQVVKLDLRPGGGFETRMRQGAGAFKPHVEGCFLEVVPARRLVWTTSLTEGWAPAEPWLALTCLLTFEPSAGGTCYHAQVIHRTAEDSRRHEDMGFQAGWGAAIDQLAGYAGRLSA